MLTLREGLEGLPEHMLPHIKYNTGRNHGYVEFLLQFGTYFQVHEAISYDMDLNAGRRGSLSLMVIISRNKGKIFSLVNKDNHISRFYSTVVAHLSEFIYQEFLSTHTNQENSLLYSILFFQEQKYN